MIIFVAGLIRGYCGFGFALICVIALSFFYLPSVITPLILCLDIVSSAWLFYKTRSLVDWKSLKLIFIFALVTLPVGSFVLIHTPVNLLRIFLSVTVILLCFGLLTRKAAMRPPDPGISCGVGMLSGFLTGVAAIGGPPVILFYLSSTRSVAVSRATMIAFFFVVDALALVSCLWYGLINAQVLTLWARMLIPLGAGIWLGNYLFKVYLNEERFRRQAIMLLMGLALVSLAKGVDLF